MDTLLQNITLGLSSILNPSSLFYCFLGVVRHHIIMDSLQLKLSESLAHLIVDVMRRTCGVASAVA